eukprot:CAMPEP_0117074466 /NCGR_PEP_ID=MMETSP0472-20121206/52464_1 /TAXON_ID=693140 ORGANISM="Tiarina fusus, Strain LIS" /NCGR_SAMPLE_ID=MMETSP0472 /ASSEMBLY_ACC=CAM_ASM_000603 /LENGTH=155 /DNA_ID=CAMNT_0004799499 /DNA_START=287 /DNA_END=751 /DNA_ORIENTATION=+
MNISEAKILLVKMEDQIRDRLCSDGNEPEREVHCAESSNYIVLQEHLDDICSLRDLFVKQSQALSMLQEHQADVEELSQSRMSAFDEVLQDPDDFSASSILDQTEARKINKSFEETVETLDDAIFKTLQEISPTCTSKHSKGLFADSGQTTFGFY